MIYISGPSFVYTNCLNGLLSLRQKLSVVSEPQSYYLFILILLLVLCHGKLISIQGAFMKLACKNSNDL
jgi:hypothetical protein